MDTIWPWLHLIAAAYWLGGLIMLAIVTMSAIRTLERTAFRALIRRVGRAFFAGSLIAWAVLAVSGVAMATARLHSIGDLTASAYGRTLALKSSLFVLVIIATIAHTVAGGRASPGTLRLSRVLSPLILLFTLAIFFLAVRLASG
jgi:putative copper export protein